MEAMKIKAKPDANSVPMDAREDGSLEKFITAFNQLEVEADLFSRCKDNEGFHWWDVARYSVQFVIATEKDLVGSKKEKSASKFERAFHFVKHTVGVALFIWGLATLRSQKIDMLYVSTRALEAACAPFLEKASCVLYANKTGIVNPPHQALSKLTIDFLLRLITPLFRVPAEVTLEAAQIAAKIKDKFGVDADLCGPMLHKYKQARAAFWLWGIILNRLPALKQILFVNDDTLRPLISLAREKGIETLEIQHGYMGSSHFAYSYPKLPFALPSFPDKVLITRDTGDITFPIAQLTVKKSDRCASEGLRDIDVLVGGSPTRSQEMRDIVKALAELGLSIGVKLHPAQTEDSSGLRPLFSADILTIFDAGEDFNSLASRSHIYVPANSTSTTVFEAVEAGADLITINYGGQKLTNMCDPIATAQVNSFDSLRDTVVSHLEQRQE
ncbi:MAG: hypothetical protein P8P30_05110 [Rickettsiales bacterium]|nr:hypothetical protein [Rickettsiales bacterium]